MIQPHGGKLIDRVLKGAALKDAETKAKTLPGIRLDAEQTSDIENIATGVFSPLEGFLGEKDFRSVLDKMRLGNGLAWTIPVVLAVDKKTADGCGMKPYPVDQWFGGRMADDWAAIVKDVAKRPFITAGFSAYVLLVPLALTSTAGMIRRLGGRAWRRLHRLAYVAAAAGIVHYWWLVKLDTRPPRNYAILLAALLLVRLFAVRKS